MADETLDIKVDDGGSATVVSNKLLEVAASADTVATSTDKSTAALKKNTTALNTEAAASDRAAVAVKGYVDAQGNYIRIVGSNRNLTEAQVTAQGALSNAYSTTSIEAGRAAAGYGPLNAGLTASQAAAAASRASIVELTSGLAGSATSAQAAGVGLNQVGAAGNAAAVGLVNGRNAFAGVASAGQTAAAGIGAVGTAAGAVTPAVTAAGAASRAAAVAANDNARAHVSLGQAFGSAGQAASQFGGVLASLGLAVGAATVIKYADSYTEVQNKLRLVTTSQQQLDDVMRQSFAIAQQTATPFGTIAELYGRIQQRADSLKLATSDVGTVVSTLATAFQISGVSGETASRVIEQFNQALAKGKPDMQDFKSLIQSTPVVEQAFIAGLQKIGVSITGGLGPALTAGTVSMQQLLQAMVAINPTMQTLAANSVPTVAQGFTRLTNAFEQYIGNANQGNAVTGTLISTLGVLANNMQTVVPIAISLGGVLAFGMIAGAISSIVSLAGAFSGLLAVLVANPAALVAITVAVSAAIPLWNRYGDTIKSFIGNLLGVGPAAAAAATNQNAAAASASSLGGAVQSAGAKVQALNAQVVATKAALDASTPGTAQYTVALQANQSATEAASTASKEYETALKALQSQQQANAQAAKTFADTINKLQNLNAYGEQLETTTQFLQRMKAAQEAATKAYQDTIAPLTASAQAVNALAIAAAGYTDAQAKAAAATQTGIAGFDQYGQSAARAAANLKALTGDAGLFTQAELDANSSINQGQSAMRSAASAVNDLGAAFRQAGNDAQFFAINSRDANTVAGQIGGGTASGLESTDPYSLAVFGRGQSGLYSSNDIQNMKNNLAAQKAAADAVANARNKAAADAALIRAGFTPDGSTAGRQTAANTNNSAIAANTAALTANTAATTRNTTATTLPDLLVQSGSTYSTGDSITQVTNDNPRPTVTVGSNTQVSAPTPVAASRPDTFGANLRSNTTVVLNIKSDDYGQFKRSDRQIAQDIGTRVAMAVNS